MDNLQGWLKPEAQALLGLGSSLGEGYLQYLEAMGYDGKGNGEVK